jgi:hypothetical protein
VPKTFTLKFFQDAGKRGGKATSPAKAKASRENGKLGGRPKTVKNKKKVTR